MEVEKNIHSKANASSFTRINSTVNRVIFLLMKRSFDLFISSLLILLLGPIIILTSFLIYKKEGTPIFKKEVKAGKNGYSYNLYTFRTLTNSSKVIKSLPPHPFPQSWEQGVPNTFSYKEEVFSIRTTIGSFLIKYKLASIPKLFNIVKGNMSFIGPEPENADIVTYYNSHQRRRLNIKPGLFSYDQMKREQSNYSTYGYDAKVTNDLYYIKNCSYLIDFKILITMLGSRMK